MLISEAMGFVSPRSVRFAIRRIGKLRLICQFVKENLHIKGYTVTEGLQKKDFSGRIGS